MTSYGFREPRTVTLEGGRHKVTLIGTRAECRCGVAPDAFATVLGAMLWARLHVEQQP